MADKIVKHPIGDNLLKINDVEYQPLGVDKVIYGLENPEKTEVRKDPDTGLNYARNEVEQQEIFSLSAQKHRCWFIIDLETGKHGWFPGCIIHGTVNAGVELKASPDDSSETIETLEGSSIITVLDIMTIDRKEFDENEWHKVKFTQEGYIRSSLIYDLRYANPNSAD